MCGMEYTQMRFLYKKGCVYGLFHILAYALKYAFFGKHKRENLRPFRKHGQRNAL